MNWTEYVSILKEFRMRFGRMPPSMLTEQGALHHMRTALSESAVAPRDATDETRVAAVDRVRHHVPDGRASP